jgi:hypothetical protein
MKEEKVQKVLTFSFYMGDYYSTIFTNKGIYLIKQSEPRKLLGLSSVTYIPGENLMVLLNKQKTRKKIFKEKKHLEKMSIEEVKKRASEEFMFRDIEEGVVKEGRTACCITIFIPTGGRFIKHRAYDIEFPLEDFNRMANFLEPRGFIVKAR